MFTPIIKDDEKVVLLGSRMDQLLTACYMQYRHVLNNKMRTDNAASNAKEVMRLFQYLTMVLMSTYHHSELTRFLWKIFSLGGLGLTKYFSVCK